MGSSFFPTTSSTSTTTTSTSSSLTSSYHTSSPSAYFTSLARRRQQKKMSITQTYYLAHAARKKLTREASRADHDLRLLVGHANLLDSLMLELADAEQEQERWFNQTVHGVTKGSPSESRHIQWAESVVEDPEDDWDPEDVSDSDLSDDSDLEEDDYEPAYTPVRRRAPSPVAIVREKEIEEDYDSDSDSDFEYDDAEDLEELTLTRSPSRQTPPELSSDSDEESEEESMPPSPPQPTLDTFSEKQAEATELPLSGNGFEGGYYVSNGSQNAIIEAY
ncbi:hypothetical protein BDV27DRAFT_131059 [Aspergillus caelatus]|uniref:Uncharacterized protein n=2 Tax=Aspergillus subgen. Circumdati TaxID=2720871 RepID=A0A5N6ZYQ9_9EURO|nr:uncharacterized protein BDV27DRAFT_131059 [Aspergillus caelatus]KAE8362707.1 hypothetical protein BDV27DRAFT_131059 [Aspergillus caelatus]KAE8420561.1 hypothetical protein BDV36DRAFT_106698 [Aspergillus pseudocaelatus]